MGVKKSFHVLMEATDRIKKKQKKINQWSSRSCHVTSEVFEKMWLLPCYKVLQHFQITRTYKMLWFRLKRKRSEAH